MLYQIHGLLYYSQALHQNNIRLILKSEACDNNTFDWQNTALFPDLLREDQRETSEVANSPYSLGLSGTA